MSQVTKYMYVSGANLWDEIKKDAEVFQINGMQGL